MKSTQAIGATAIKDLRTNIFSILDDAGKKIELAIVDDFESSGFIVYGISGRYELDFANCEMNVEYKGRRLIITMSHRGISYDVKGMGGSSSSNARILAKKLEKR